MSEDSGYRVDEQLLGDVESLLSFWPLVRDHSEIGPREAMRVLATWSHLQRFSPDLLDHEIVGRLNDAVQGDATKLVERFSELTFIDDWVDDSEALDESWDWILDNDAADEADLSEICLFDVLDRFSLACHASQRLLPNGSEVPEGLCALIEEVATGEDFLRDHPDVFLGAIEIASANLARYRPDLDQVDERLWETTLKHRVLEELLEERAAGLTQRLTQREINELIAIGRDIERDQKRSIPISTSTRQRRSQSLATYVQNGLGLAAATGITSQARQPLDLIEREEYEVEGEASVRFHLGINVDEAGQPRSLSLWLTPTQPSGAWGQDAGRFDRARLRVPQVSDPIELRLRRANATFTPPAELAVHLENWIDDLQIDLIDTQGNIRRVKLSLE